MKIILPFIVIHRRIDLLIKIFILISIDCLGQGGKIAGRIITADQQLDFSYLTIILKPDNELIIGTELGVAPDSNGQFTIDQIGEGIYNLAIRQIGYRTAITYGIRIASDTLVKLDLVYPPPCTFTTNKKVCIGGHQDNIIPIVYGLPNKRTMEKSKKGKIYLGGCNLTDCDPHFFCKIHKREL